MRAASSTPTQAHRTPLNPIRMPSIVAIASELAANPATKLTGMPHFQQLSISYIMKKAKMTLLMMCLQLQCRNMAERVSQQYNLSDLIFSTSSANLFISVGDWRNQRQPPGVYIERERTKTMMQAPSRAVVKDTNWKLGQILFLTISRKPVSALVCGLVLRNGILTLINQDYNGGESNSVTQIKNRPKGGGSSDNPKVDHALD